MTQKAFVEEVIEEIGTQSLAKLGLNIFSLNTYAAYGASAQMTSDTARAYNQHKKNDKFFGQTFEELDIGIQNVKDSLFNTGNKTYTTDTLADIKYAQDILKSNKKIENLDEKDRQKVEYILAYYADEVENMDFSDPILAALAHKNHTTTDTVTLDKEGNVIKTAQLKVIKDTEGLLEDRYLDGENAPDELKMPFDDYKRHREKLEEMIAKGKNNPNDEKAVDKARKAEKALEKLNANNLCNRLMCENPNAAAVVFQGVSAGGHILQAGTSDAVVVALSTLASGIVWEIKDMFNSKMDSETSVLERIKRLFQRTIEAFQKTFTRGAGFGAIDAIVGIVGQIFKSIARDLKRIWDSLRTSAKSIYNAIYDYVSGKITSMQELLRTILKSLFSAAAVIGVAILQKKLEVEMIAFLAPIGAFSAHFASILATILSITAGAFAVVLAMRSIDMALDAFFGAFDYARLSAQRAEAIATLCAENLPALIAEREEIERLIESTHKERLMTLDSSFADCAIAMENNDVDAYTEALQKINALWGAELKIKTMNDVKAILQKPNRTGCLEW